MATTFKNKVVSQIGIEKIEVLASDDNKRITVVGFSLANLTDGVVLVDVSLRDVDSTEGFYAKELILPPNTSLRVLNGGEKLILTPNNNLYVRSNVADSIDCILSTVEII
tara:strand:- start:3976 stop:4305 length:330 start_codon:yes stop_codon:yes gene_type:complete